jgi:hypothetical protein
VVAVVLKCFYVDELYPCWSLSDVPTDRDLQIYKVYGEFTEEELLFIDKAETDWETSQKLMEERYNKSRGT